MCFLSDEDSIEKFTKLIEKAIKNGLGFNIPVFVISKDKLEDILHNAPD